MIRFTCPTCQKVLKAPDDSSGRKTHCPSCRQRLLIPPPIQVQNKTVLGKPMPESAATLPVPASDWLKDVRTAEEKSRNPLPPSTGPITVFCPNCNARLLVDAAQADGEVECLQCGRWFALGGGDRCAPDSSPASSADDSSPPVLEPAEVPVLELAEVPAPKATSYGAEWGCGAAILAVIAMIVVSVIALNYEQQRIKIGGMALTGASQREIEKEEDRQREENRFFCIMVVLIPIMITLVVLTVLRLSSRKLPVHYSRKCPECLMGVPRKATRCGHCGSVLPDGIEGMS